MIERIGTDIIEIEKIKHYSQRKCFLNKVFTQKEIDYAKRKEDSASHLATTFAAKEAIFKALGTGWLEGQDIEIKRDKEGRPSAVLSGNLEKLSKSKKILLSLSYNGNFAIAFAIIIEKNKK